MSFKSRKEWEITGFVGIEFEVEVLSDHPDLFLDGAHPTGLPWGCAVKEVQVAMAFQRANRSVALLIRLAHWQLQGDPALADKVDATRGAIKVRKFDFSEQPRRSYYVAAGGAQNILRLITFPDGETNRNRRDLGRFVRRALSSLKSLFDDM